MAKAPTRPKRPGNLYPSRRNPYRNLYDLGVWEKFRREQLAFRILCEVCDRPANEIHHLVPTALAPQLLLEPTNTLALCRKCHSTITGVHEPRYLTSGIMPDRYVIVGKPASGKSTFIAERASATAVIWDWDAECEHLGLSVPLSDHNHLLMKNRRRRWIDKLRPNDEAWAIVTHPIAAYGIATDMRAQMFYLAVDPHVRESRLAERLRS